MEKWGILGSIFASEKRRQENPQERYFEGKEFRVDICGDFLTRSPIMWTFFVRNLNFDNTEI